MGKGTRRLAFALLSLSAGGAVAVAQGRRCSMGPPRRAVTLPQRGLVGRQGDELQGPCDSVPAADWVRTPGRTDLLVATEGPAGSGRYWTVTVGVAPRGQAEPSRGTCLTTSTLGWRTLRNFGDAPLSWSADRDQDGRPELVLWSSFPIGSDASAAEYGLVAWVYEFDGRRALALDWPMSRAIARELAAAYRRPFEAVELQAQRDRAAQALEDFAGERCTQRTPAGR